MIGQYTTVKQAMAPLNKMMQSLKQVVKFQERLMRDADGRMAAAQRAFDQQKASFAETEASTSSEIAMAAAMIANLESIMGTSTTADEPK